MKQDSEVTYSRAVVEQLVEGKYSLVAMTRTKVVVVGESRGGSVRVTAWGVFV